MSRFFSRYVVSIVFVVCLIALILLTVFVVRHLFILRFLAADTGYFIFPNIAIHGTMVGGLSPQDAERTLQNTFQPGLDRQTIGLSYNDSLVYSFTFQDFGAIYDFSALVEMAFQYGRTGTRQERYTAIRGLEDKALNITEMPGYSFDVSLIPVRLEAVRTQSTIMPVNASMRLEGEEFVITGGTPGRTPNLEAAVEELRLLLSRNQSGVIPLQMQAIDPTYSIAHFERSQSLLGEFATSFLYYGGDETPRNVNVRLAASHIHNKLVFPGEVFSLREVVGPSTPERGYALATVIVGGQLVDGYGGGICQVASTLYNAVLFAELPIVERANHSLRVQYLDYAFDAAIAGDYMDLKFTNDSEHPILVASSAREGILHIRIFGHETRPANRSLAFENELLEVISPEPDKILYDEQLPSGHVLINTESHDGFKYALYKLIFEDGELVGRERTNISIYRPIQGIVTRGAGAAVVEENTEENTENNTETSVEDNTEEEIAVENYSESQ